MSEPLDPRRADDPVFPAPAQPPAEPPTTLWSPAAASAEPTASDPTLGWPPPAPAPVSATPISSTTQFPPGYPAADPYAGAALPVPYPPAPASYPMSAPTSYPPGYGGYPVMVAPAGMYGFDPITGQAYSPKSKTTAGLLQLLPAIFFSLGGIGRLYAGNTTIGILQIVSSVVGWVAFWCGLTLNVLVLFLPLFLYGGLWLWFVIDGIMMLAGRPVDGEGHLLRT